MIDIATAQTRLQISGLHGTFSSPHLTTQTHCINLLSLHPKTAINSIHNQNPELANATKTKKMAAETNSKRTSNSHIIAELEALSQSLYHSNTSSIPSLQSAPRRTASLVLPRNSVPPIAAPNDEKPLAVNPKPRSRRMSLSPWRSRPKLDKEEEDDEDGRRIIAPANKSIMEDDDSGSGKKGIWGWKPIRALSHIGMQKLSCLFSVEVVAIQGLPASMNGLRLSVCVRKKETKDGAVQTMPSRVQQGGADFEETLFIRCHVYYTPGAQMKLEPRPFLVYAFAVDAGELDFGRSSVDLSRMIQESIDKSSEGARVRQWDTSFNLTGKARGGELVLKLGFQIMEKDGGVGIYSLAEGQKSAKAGNMGSSSARKQSKFSFSVPSPKLSSRAAEAWTPSQPAGGNSNLPEIDDLNLDDDEPPPQKAEEQEVPDSKMEDDLPDFEVVDKGVEIQETGDHKAKEVKEEEDDDDDSSSEGNSEKKSEEVVKEIVHEKVHLTRLTELDSLAQQIKALEAMLKEEKSETQDEETQSQKLDADEENLTMEFLQLLEDSESNDGSKQVKSEGHQEKNLQRAESGSVYIPDLGRGLGSVIQTRNGGFLAAMNPLDTALARKDTPKLAMQISQPMIIRSKAANGFELFQRMASLGLEELGSEILSSMPMEELKGKTAEQIAFEGIASAIIQGRNKEGASSSAARSIAAVKSMVNAMSTGRKERISTGIWNLSEDPLTVDEVLAYAMQKLEAMSVEALKIQADITEEEAPFDVSPLIIKGQDNKDLLASAIPIEEWISSKSLKGSSEENGVTISVVVQLRDPVRQYEAVGGPMIALIHGSCADVKPGKYDEEKTFKLANLQVAGFKARDAEKKTEWDSQKQRLTAMQWLVAYGFGKAGKRGKRQVSEGQDFLWSLSSRVMADMWLKAIRNPDVKFTK